MEQVKIGKFIAESRKKIGLTQMQLAEKLNITDRAISKWENGKSMPDSSIMLELCDVLKISVNDLLNGEIVKMDNYKEKSEQNLLEMVKQKEHSDRQMLTLEIVIGVLSVIILLSLTFIAAFLEMENWFRITLIVFAFVVSITGLMFAMKIEQTAGYYECGKCHHKYVPSFSSVLWAPHINRTRCMKCPECGKISWQKKVLRK
ncbi:MAG: helix-turn-helix domain-containing protein [Clostridia bacterium]|nr:helix-turn-helix domain-containing protein [Clostridia bacterium]